MDKVIKVVNVVCFVTFLAYAYAMFIHPVINSGGSWKYVHSVWYSWQALNVGMLAFSSSVIAFNISKYNGKKKREREFVAAKALLPESLSELTKYLKKCTPMLVNAWERASDCSDRCSTPLVHSHPELPQSYRAVFSSCIASAENEVGEYLAYILMRLQIHHSRLSSLQNEFSEDEHVSQIPENIMSYMYCLAELQALINKLFGFARSIEGFDGNNLTLEDFGTAYCMLNIEVDDIDGLWGFTTRVYENRR
ncbi:hypothetical protein INR79_09070 [Vibrio sp. SCSIO 43132]|uniref:hypothetical protein n=1 Tax=Vibrio sp. SCSIO 43132 TaxID=2779363 RepID=UPI001CAA23AF|nr:hypothetical protein [Vibrio sp. SCSIO 43132]UAB68703.1 hypothetical protein INR79_09070 [Vibrio sp. SCSIO 43132]